MGFERVVSLQGMLFLLIVIGVFAKRKSILPEESNKVLTDFLINIILPCNIINSFRAELKIEVLINFVRIFLLAFGIQIFAIIINNFLYRNQSEERQKVLKYATVISNAGFMGMAVVEGVFGMAGAMYASISLISQRALLWSAGLAYFTKANTKKELFKKILTHPCLVSVYIGLILMIFQIPLPDFLGRTIRSIGNTTTPVSMILIGLILGEIKDLKNFVTKTVMFYTTIRLVGLPLIVFLVGKFFGFDEILIGVQILITGMPAASTTAILAGKYNGDVEFATKCILVSSALSMITIPIWCLILKI
ncbi:AEC family transporter [Fusobacterium sp.]|uniref:AEC family transporter n=1 Tax=Fusobacterium sp. TaxID=68766 RepID=UPI00260992D7|nr:AEC family transporter [Fusobacterium sp.]